MMVPVSSLALIYTYPKNELLRVMNFVTIPGLIGAVIGPVLGGWIVEAASWHWIFLINIPIGLAGMFFAARYMPNFKGKQSHFDTIGLLLFGGGLIFLTFGFETGGGKTLNLNLLLASIILAFLFLAGYYMHAKKVKNPLISLELFRIRTLSVSVAGNLCTRLGISGMPFLLPLMMQLAFSYSPTVSGAMLILSALATITAKSWVVPIIKRFGYKRVLISNTLILSVIISSFALFDKSTPLIYIAPLLIVFGFVNSMQITSMNTIALSDIDNSTASGANSLLMTIQRLSISFGVGVAAMILRIMEDSDLTKGDIGLSFKYTFIAMGIITALSVLVFFKLKNSDGSQMAGRG
jgi:MFS family permease